MSSVPSRPTSDLPEPVFRLSVQQYHNMIQSGILADDDPVELLEGVLAFKMPKNPLHRIALARIRKALEPILPGEFSLQLQDPITLSDSEPEPDAAIIRGQAEDYADRHPGPPDVLLVIEVADTSLARDRGVKLRSYARAGIAVYWIINLPDRQVEVFTDPDRTLPDAAYRSRQVLRGDQLVSVRLNDALVADLSISTLLP